MVGAVGRVEGVGRIGRPLGRVVVPSLINRVSDSKKATICFLSPSLAEGSLAILKASLSLMTAAGCNTWGVLQ